MIFGNDRDELRRNYAKAWEKRTSGALLTPLEEQIARVIEDHPEYHGIFADKNLQRDYLPGDGESNPFLHMGLHLAIRDQIATDRPAGVRAEFERLARKKGGSHAAEHVMLECLAKTLWESQRDNTPPDEERYIQRVRRSD